MTQARAGLLPLYLTLYDERLPETRGPMEAILRQAADGLAHTGIAVDVAGVCRNRDEVQRAVAQFGASGADAIIVLFLAYSPSLESADVLCGQPLPLIICDTTISPTFGISTGPDQILYNHGIHGVQDLTSVLRRRGRVYDVVAGHMSNSDVLARTAARVRAAKAASLLRQTRALRIGHTFGGMGDFAVGDDVLARRLGVRVTEIAVDDMADSVRRVSADEIDVEIRADRDRFEVVSPLEVHRRSVRVGLGMRRMLEAGGYDAFSLNFMEFDSSDEPIDVVPFLEASKAMGRGVGYAGEGDVLTASLVGALSRGLGNVTFTEIFCPDWAGGTLFLSHMGEVNPQILAGRGVLIEKPFPFTGAKNPAMVTGPWRSGQALLVNLLLGPQEQFELLVAPVEVLDEGPDNPMREQIRSWIKPKHEAGVASFLEQYSLAGGTHHSALVYACAPETLVVFASSAGLRCQVI